MVYNQITLRVNTQTRAATLEGRDFLVFGDKVKILLTDAPGAATASLTANIWTKAAPSEAVAAGFIFTAVPKTSGSFVSNEVVLGDTETLLPALAATPPGSSVAFRLLINDAFFTFVDMDVDIRPNPTVGSTPVTNLGDPYVTRSELANALAAIDDPDFNASDVLVAKQSLKTVVEAVDGLPLDTLEETNAALKDLLARLITLCS